MNMMEQVWKVRGSRGLNAWDKMFLVTIASRGEEGMFATWHRNADDMGMGKDRYYKSRDSLLDKELIIATRRFDNTTVYKINDQKLIAWCEATQDQDSATQNADSVTQNEHSATQNGRSVRPETKKNFKKNKKKNLEEELNESVVPPSSLSNDKNINNKEDQDNAPASPIVPNVPVVMGGNTPAHSVTQNVDLTDDERRKLHWGDERWLPPIPKVKPKEDELVW